MLNNDVICSFDFYNDLLINNKIGLELTDVDPPKRDLEGHLRWNVKSA